MKSKKLECHTVCKLTIMVSFDLRIRIIINIVKQNNLKVVCLNMYKMLIRLRTFSCWMKCESLAYLSIYRIRSFQAGSSRSSAFRSLFFTTRMGSALLLIDGGRSRGVLVGSWSHGRFCFVYSSSSPELRGRWRKWGQQGIVVAIHE